MPLRLVSNLSSNFLRSHAAALLVTPFLVSVAFAQGPLPEARFPEAPNAFVQPAAVSASRSWEPSHKFWDRENKALFLAAAASNVADFAVTRSNLQNGGRELNPVVRIFGRSSSGLALNFAGESAGIVSLSYFFHRTGHHKLERAVGFVNIGASAGAVTYGLLHK